MIFNHSDHRPACRDGSPVKRVDEFCAFLTRRLVTDVQSPGLIIGAVAGARHFTPRAAISAAGHPGFEVIFPVSGSAEVAACGVNDAVGNLECIEQFAFKRSHFFVNRVAVLGQREREHLDFGELVHAVQPLRRSPRRARLYARTPSIFTADTAGGACMMLPRKVPSAASTSARPSPAGNGASSSMHPSRSSVLVVTPSWITPS